MLRWLQPKRAPPRTLYVPNIQLVSSARVLPEVQTGCPEVSGRGEAASVILDEVGHLPAETVWVAPMPSRLVVSTT